MQRLFLRALAMTAILAPATALAHTGHGEAGGFVHGLMHPLGGIDHILAMVTVGLLAAQLGDRAQWLVPASFAGVMVIGGVAGFAGLALPWTEAVIAISVLVLGGVVAASLALPVAAAMGLVAVFALFHGYAHGVEIPANASAAAYAGGFVAATLVLHGAGLAAGTVAARTSGSRVLRLTGGAVAAAGLVLIGSL